MISCPDEELSRSARDTVTGVDPNGQKRPTIVSISDIHGYLDAARSALLTLTDHPTIEPVVETDADGRLHWAGENYVLVFNGDLIDRGPANEGVLEMVGRLVAEAPPGRVRITLGNHEAIALSPMHFGFGEWYSGDLDPSDRRAFLEVILSGHVVGAYNGYNVTYAHAGASEPYDVESVNESLVSATEELSDVAGTIEDGRTQRRVVEEYTDVLGTGNAHLKGPDAGLAWLDFSYLPADSPPQIVGHTRHTEPRQKGNVFCQNVLRNTRSSSGGEAVFLETPTELVALLRQSDGGVERTRLTDFN